MSTRIVLAGALALVLTACGGGDGNGDAGADNTDADHDGGVTVVATEFEFDPTDMTIPADTATEVTVDNRGVVEHDLTIDELGVEIYAEPGSTATGSITAPAGTYELHCSIPGHRDAGMVGTLTVEG